MWGVPARSRCTKAVLDDVASPPFFVVHVVHGDTSSICADAVSGSQPFCSCGQWDMCCDGGGEGDKGELDA